MFGEIDLTLKRISEEIIHDSSISQNENLLFLGINSGGVPLTERIVQILASKRVNVPYGQIDPYHYRDDKNMRPKKINIGDNIPGNSVEGRTIILIEDDFFTGRTALACIKRVGDYGRPCSVKLATLVFREGHRQYPITPDYIGISILTNTNWFVRVDGLDRVVIGEKIE